VQECDERVVLRERTWWGEIGQTSELAQVFSTVSLSKGGQGPSTDDERGVDVELNKERKEREEVCQNRVQL